MMSEFQDQVIAEMKKLKQRALRLTRNPDEADDLVQDTVIRAIANEDRFTPGTNLAAWLTVILRNQFFAVIRVSGRTVADIDDAIARTLPANDDQFSAYAAKEVISFIVEIPMAYRKPLLLAAQGLTIDEIAAVIGVPTGTVKSRIHRARHMLADLTGETLPRLYDFVEQAAE